MIITVESITGRVSKCTVNPFETVQNLKALIWKQDGVSPLQQCLVFKGEELENGRRLKDYEMTDGAVVKLILTTRSGPLSLNDKFAYESESVNAKNNVMITNLVDNLKSANISGNPFPTSDNLALLLNDQVRLRLLQVLSSDEAFRVNGEGHKLKIRSSDGQTSVSTPTHDSFDREDCGRHYSATRRFEENMRTMQKMREIRLTMDRLNQEKARRKAANGVENYFKPKNDSTHLTNYVFLRQRRASGSASSGSFSRLRPSRGGLFSVASGSGTSNQRSNFLSAEDTSAKESSAGETELEDNKPTKSPFFRPSEINEKLQDDLLSPSNLAQYGETRNNFLSSKREKHAIPRSSSCSDVDPDSSALFSSDHDLVHKSDFDLEYYTPDGYLSYNEMNECEYSGSCRPYEGVCGSPQRETSGSDHVEVFEDAVEGTMSNLPFSSDMDLEDEPSEEPISSGAVICDLSTAAGLAARRSKVRKKYSIQRHGLQKRNAQTGNALSRSAAIECDSYGCFGAAPNFASAAVCPNEAGAAFSPPKLARSSTNQGRFAHRRTRSKPRPALAPPKLQSTTTGGETSSDEQHDDEEDGLQDSSASSTAAKAEKNARLLLHSSATANNQNKVPPPANSMANPKCRFPYNNRTYNAPKKLLNPGDKMRSSVTHCCATSLATDADSTPVASSSVALYSSCAPSSPASALPTVVRNHKLPQSSQSQQRCNVCGCRLNLSTTFHCRCGKTICSRHRSSDSHSCSYEMKREITFSVATERKRCVAAASSASEHSPLPRL